MILDYNIFKNIQGKDSTPEKLFYVLEQQPHKILYADFSKNLYDNGYFGSYNRAFLKETKEDLKIEYLGKLYKTEIFEKGGRDIIMKHYKDDVKDLESLKNLLRHNGSIKEDANFPDDPSKSSACESISPRCDWKGGSLFGGTDTKVTNLDLVEKISAVAVAGPVWNENDPSTLFVWPDKENTNFRLGVPNQFKFDYLLMSPENIWCDKKSDVYKFK